MTLKGWLQKARKELAEEEWSPAIQAFVDWRKEKKKVKNDLQL